MYETRGRHSRLEEPDPGFASGYQSVDGHFQTWEQPLVPLQPLDAQWDPAEELAHLLHEAIEDERNGASPPTESPAGPDVQYADSVPLDYADSVSLDYADNDPLDYVDNDPLDYADNDAFDGLAKITDELPPLRPSPSRRRRRSRKREIGVLRTTSFFLAAAAAVVVSMVCVFGGIVSYGPLRHLAEYRTSTGAVGWWPLLVYGPCMVASLSILRAALHRRRAAHSWAVVLVFASVTMFLCIAQAPRTPVDAAAAALPALAVLACFQQLVRQVTLTRPPRQTNPRHRTRPVTPPSPTRPTGPTGPSGRKPV
jgi:hypothetical protein